ncbi:hypothetical protein AG1IA_05466 [Rhizoctonia solani AG-1 IA]|uniref:Uncharacterized protein n=1 Tax=Thanatephorus cucumeris (strain AG1-IA) TaxID=983506 RepID=L8WQU2_THACA|nr:hypothetical protein AG1IA_05466 [Rhizoctonia solani AG-1 IA]
MHELIMNYGQPGKHGTTFNFIGRCHNILTSCYSLVRCEPPRHPANAFAPINTAPPAHIPMRFSKRLHADIIPVLSSP